MEVISELGDYLYGLSASNLMERQDGVPSVGPMDQIEKRNIGVGPTPMRSEIQLDR
jgi:hypothetical protein